MVGSTCDPKLYKRDSTGEEEEGDEGLRNKEEEEALRERHRVFLSTVLGRAKEMQLARLEKRSFMRNLAPKLVNY